MRNIALIAAREASKLTQKELAERVGCTQTSISKYETGECYPRMTIAKRISLILDIPLEVFSNEQVR